MHKKGKTVVRKVNNMVRREYGYGFFMAVTYVQWQMDTVSLMILTHEYNKRRIMAIIL